MIRLTKKNSGFSLVELIVSLVILTTIYMVMLRIFSWQKSVSVESELYTKAIFLGRELMHTILSDKYDENRVSPWTPAVSLGLDFNDATYDDVDDYAGHVNNNMPDYPGFSESVRVFYVYPSAIDDSVSVITDIKKIIVTVTHAGIEPVVLETIMSSHY